MLLVSMCDGGGLRDITGRELGMKGDSRGITIKGDRLFAACGASRFKRGIYELTWNEGSQEFDPKCLYEQNRDWHGLYSLPNGFLAVDAKFVIKFDESLNEVERWKPLNCGHVNDVCIWKDEIIVSGFQRGPCKLDGTQLFRNMAQPHSLVVDDHDNLWSCDSTEGALLKNGDIFAQVEGYARGVLVLQDSVMLGVSNDRKGTHKVGKTRVVEFRLDDGSQVQTTPVDGNEIYALLDHPLP